MPIFNLYTLDAIENPRLQSIVGKLSPYNFTTKVNPEVEHVIPDALSCHAVDEPQLQDLLAGMEFSIHYIVTSATQ